MRRGNTEKINSKGIEKAEKERIEIEKNEIEDINKEIEGAKQNQSLVKQGIEGSIFQEASDAFKEGGKVASNAAGTYVEKKSSKVGDFAENHIKEGKNLENESKIEKTKLKTIEHHMSKTNNTKTGEMYTKAGYTKSVLNTIEVYNTTSIEIQNTGKKAKDIANNQKKEGQNIKNNI